MFEQPWFQDNIWHNLWRFNYTYLTSRLWGVWLLGVFVILSVLLFLLRNALRNKHIYGGVFNKQIWKFDITDKAQWGALFVLMISLLLTEIYIFTGEHSLFENYDLMAINTTRTMRFGLVASFDFIRVTPLASWYLSTLYAVTQNILLIKTFVFAQIILMVWVLYVAFNYIPVARRLIMIAVLLLMPTMLQTSNIIFPERDMVIVLALSFICLRKYVELHKVRWAAAFLFFANVSFYTKETCLIFYFGVAVVSIVYNILIGEIRLTSFMHPLKTIKKMPLEFLIGISLLCYSIVYGLLQIGDNFYISANHQTLKEQFISYRLELGLALIALILALYRWRKLGMPKVNPLFTLGLLMGALAVTAFVVGIMKLAPSTPHLAGRSYYLLAAVVFVLAYIFEYLNSKIILSLLSVAVLSYSIIMNINYRRNENGEYYREVAEVMVKNSVPGSVTPMFVVEQPYRTKILWQWVVETWSTAYRYYFNDRVFVIKSDVHYLDRSVYNKLALFSRIGLIYFPIVPQGMPAQDDWLIISKNNQTVKADKLRRMYSDNLIYENKLFEVYRPKK